MNNTCNGHVYRFGRTTFYRCFGDGTRVELTDGVVPTTCPACERTAQPTTLRRARVRVVTTTQIEIRVPSLGAWVTHSEKRQVLA